MIDWNKGKAVEFLLESLALGNSDDVLPIYVGDDRTDEDAFKVIFTQIYILCEINTLLLLDTLCYLLIFLR